ncbi:MAG: hypothetical protein DCC88_07740 [Spirobacillus cienkowskii]|jgi:hypothetical protein|uniref:Uncharacterized protein n=1 Tax=Spirobacillus cienkowskii TaxID=495820 RepID=A0A369KQT6_9BACT|nr:MAG: hypothetical protein DCC88_07740 [Spirobacillus cienkowskii]
MANIRLKKTESIERQKNYPKDEQNEAKNEQFPSQAVEDELSKKRKMILTGITTGVTVAGATAAGILFLGPYTPFGDNSSEKKNVAAVAPNLQKPEVVPKVDGKVATPNVVSEKPAVAIVAPEAKSNTENSNQVPAAIVVPSPVEKPVAVEKKQVIAKEKSVAKSITPPSALVKPNLQKGLTTTYNYDIQDGGPVIEAPSQKKIVVSRDPNFKTIYLNGFADQTGKYRISIPPPGEIYWKEEGKFANKITINPPKETGIQANIPSKLNFKDVINWSATGKVSFFRVEVASDVDFLNKVKVFSTNKTSFPVQVIGQGNWFVRIAALNLHSGTWDFTKVFSLEIEPSEVSASAPAASQTPQEESTPPPHTPPTEEQHNQLDERPVPANTESGVEPPSLPAEAVTPVEPVNPVEPVTPVNPVNPADAAVPEASSPTP